MALSETGKAIGKVTKLLTEHLNRITGLNITVGRPEPPSSGLSNPRLNLFLYEAQFDPSLRNVPPDEGQQPPLWLVLKYLITAFDDSGNSDTIPAHEYLGEGIRVLQGLNFIPLNSGLLLPTDILDALQDNPEPLKIDFIATPSDLLSQLMQGSDEKYRFSIGFQVRPIMIATGEPPSYSLLVGVDYTKSPLEVTGEKGVQVAVIPSMGPKITDVSPSKFEAGSTLTILGSDLNLSGLYVRLGPADLSVTAQQPDKLECVVNGTIAGDGMISAGSYPVSVVQTLPTGRRRSSNLLVGNLLPRLDNAEFTTDPQPDVVGTVTIYGACLGGKEDDIFVALHQDGRVVKMFDQFTLTEQDQLALEISTADEVPAGKYRLILRVNGQQAKNSPEVEIVAV